MYTQKIENIFDHIQDHSRLGLENRFLQNKSGRIFCFRQVYFTKSCQQIWGCVNHSFILFIHHIWGETVLLIRQTSDRMRYFTFFQDKLHSVNIQDDQSWAFSESVLISIVRAISVVKCLRVTLQHNNEFNLLLLFFVI